MGHRDWTAVHHLHRPHRRRHVPFPLARHAHLCVGCLWRIGQGNLTIFFWKIAGFCSFHIWAPLNRLRCGHVVRDFENEAKTRCNKTIRVNLCKKIPQSISKRITCIWFFFPALGHSWWHVQTDFPRPRKWHQRRYGKTIGHTISCRDFKCRPSSKSCVIYHFHPQWFY